MANDMKHLISEKFLELAKTKSLDDITVVDLVKECHISRQTFYYHFHDIMEVVEYVIKNNLQLIVDRCVAETTLDGRVRSFVTSYYEFYPLLNRSIKSHRFNQVQTLLVSALKKSLEDYKSTLPITQHLEADEADLVYDFYAHGLVGFLLERKIRDESDIEALSSQIYKIINLSPHVK